MTGDDDDFGALGLGDLLDLLERLHAVQAGEPDVEEHDFIGLACEFEEAFFAAFDGVAGVAFVFQDAGERLADGGFVVDDEDSGGLHWRTLAEERS